MEDVYLGFGGFRRRSQVNSVKMWRTMREQMGSRTVNDYHVVFLRSLVFEILLFPVSRPTPKN